MADQILVNGSIITLNPTKPRTRAVALRGRHIEAVGDANAMQMLARPGAVVEDLGGRVVIPGLVDAHIHLKWYAQMAAGVDLHEVPSRAEAVRRVAAHAEKTPPGEWIQGGGWWQTLWDDPSFPTAAELDAAAPENPVYLYAKSGHAAWVNSAALRAAGITAETPDPEGGQFVRDASGAPNGTLLENAMELVSSAIPAPAPEQVAAWVEAVQPRFWQAGITGVHDFDGPECFAGLQVLHARGGLGLRVLKQLRPSESLDHAQALGLRAGFGDDMLRVGALKLFLDGALGPKTAWMLEPYAGESENLGLPSMDPEAMYARVSAASAAGLPSAVHAIGDRAVREALDVFDRVRREEAARGIPPDRMRHRIEHVQLIHPDDKDRLGALGIIASMQPIHEVGDREAAAQLWGERVAWAYNWRVQLEAGAVLAFGSDAPVEPFAPLWGIHAAVTRPIENITITVDEALRAYTIGPAYAAGLEDRLGQLKPGYLADLVVLDADPYTAAPDALREIGVVGTMVDGVWRHRAF